MLILKYEKDRVPTKKGRGEHPTTGEPAARTGTASSYPMLTKMKRAAVIREPRDDGDSIPNMANTVTDTDTIA